MLRAIQKELEERKNDLDRKKPDTLYIGGGTPSLLNQKQLEELMKCVRDHYEIQDQAEITIEANPDDLTSEYLGELSDLGINRLSIGIQSFNDEDLKLMNRKHNRQQALSCLENAVKAGFDNLNVDLIYGIPGSNTIKWNKNLDTAIQFFPAHISAYHLTYEAGSVMDYRRKKSKITAIDENESIDQFNVLVDLLEMKGYCHYEISNFARDKKFSRHNMAYWTGEKYLGFGPSAHSYDGHSRRWNIARNSSYMNSRMAGEKYFEKEILDSTAKYHEFLLTSLRTTKGVDINTINEKWGANFLQHFHRQSEKYFASGKLVQKENMIKLTREGMFISDHIISELFMPT